MRPNLKDVDRKKPIVALWPFPWDKEAAKIEDPAEAFKKSKALWAEIDEKRNAKKNKEN